MINDSTVDLSVECTRSKSELIELRIDALPKARAVTTLHRKIHGKG